MLRYFAYVGAVSLVVCAAFKAPLLPAGPAHVVYRRHIRFGGIR